MKIEKKLTIEDIGWRCAGENFPCEIYIKYKEYKNKWLVQICMPECKVTGDCLLTNHEYKEIHTIKFDGEEEEESNLIANLINDAENFAEKAEDEDWKTDVMTDFDEDEEEN